MYLSVECAAALYGLRPDRGSLLSISHKRQQNGLAPAHNLRCAHNKLYINPVKTVALQPNSAHAVHLLRGKFNEWRYAAVSV